MARTPTWRLAIVALSAVALLVLAGPVAAHHNEGHSGGPPGDGAEVTEDNDSDGVPNAPDPEGDADNRHPSGKDKHEEGGSSGNQGNAASDPDDDGHGPDRSNGGADKPGATGGVDKLDQDGNNGCGNDDDFEDDNEGLCLGGQKGHAPAGEHLGGEAIAGGADAAGENAAVGGVTTETIGEAPAEVSPAGAVEGQGGFGIVPAVLGEVVAAGAGAVAGAGAAVASRAAPAAGVGPAELAFTGVNVLPLVGGVLLLGLAGFGLIKVSRRRTLV